MKSPHSLDGARELWATRLVDQEHLRLCERRSKLGYAHSLFKWVSPSGFVVADGYSGHGGRLIKMFNGTFYKGAQAEEMMNLGLEAPVNFKVFKYYEKERASAAGGRE